jgi:hypothetical protein
MFVPPSIDCDLAHLAKTLRRAGHRPRPPEPWGPAGVAVTLVNASGGHLGSVIVTQARHDDGVEWIHASIAYEHRMPAYVDLAVLKAGVFGPKREAYQIFPPADRHINIHQFALHLYGRADGLRVLPDFGAWGSI